MTPGAENAPPSGPAHPSDPREPLRILIVDDWSFDVELILFEISRSGRPHVTAVAMSRPEFLQALQELPDVIVSDFCMPSFGALDVLRIVKEKRLAVPVIVVSGTLDEQTARASLALGAADVLHKQSLERLPYAIWTAARR